MWWETSKEEAEEALDELGAEVVEEERYRHIVRVFDGATKRANRRIGKFKEFEFETEAEARVFMNECPGRKEYYKISKQEVN